MNIYKLFSTELEFNEKQNTFIRKVRNVYTIFLISCLPISKNKSEIKGQIIFNESLKFEFLIFLIPDSPVFQLN